VLSFCFFWPRAVLLLNIMPEAINLRLLISLEVYFGE